MDDFYPYLLASLPMLHLGMRPPFSFEHFLDQCRPFTPGKDFALVSDLPRPENYAEQKDRPRTIQRWIAFDTTLRNELVRLRAARKHWEPSSSLRPGESVNSSIPPLILAAGMSSSVVDAEKSLDEARWKYLEDITTGHHFDLDCLIAYAYQLRILLRWEAVNTADAETLLEQSTFSRRVP